MESKSELITLPNGKTVKVEKGLFINNAFVESVDKKCFETINPSTGKVITTVSEASSKDVDLAVEAATNAFYNVWRFVDGKERGRLLNKLADLIERDTEELAALETLDNGQTLSTAKFIDIGHSIDCYRYFAGNLKNVTLELGGKSPNIIFADADLDEAVQWAHMGIFFNHGQCCSAGSRVYVQDNIYDEFLTKFKATTESNKVGDPFEADTYQGPQVSKAQFDRYSISARDVSLREIVMSSSRN
ncbi:17857_t:CDS:2 [Racocetra fulgida]|uniref:17857_t:CDS:1 n=1 Tax=Racocetra fulgida TaxID=60492 RepID=A0A9N9G4J1_9GLOM|nr:17857_t:CDS:2 [Racocetra fulgida]